MLIARGCFARCRTPITRAATAGPDALDVVMGFGAIISVKQLIVARDVFVLLDGWSSRKKRAPAGSQLIRYFSPHSRWKVHRISADYVVKG